jgi:hypothetical protein
MISSEKLNLQHSGPHLSDDPSGAIANTMPWIEVAKDCDRTANLEREASQRQSRTVDGIEILDWIHEFSICLLVCCVVWKRVCTGLAAFGCSPSVPLAWVYSLLEALPPNPQCGSHMAFGYLHPILSALC